MREFLGNYIVNNKAETKQIAINIANHLKANDVLAFRGDLGSGKTFFCQHIIKKLCGNVNVTSPTFNLLQIYDHQPNCSIYHYDLYRLKYIDEIYELGIEEAFTDNICLIEWPEIIQSILPFNTIYIDLKLLTNNSRSISISTQN